MAKRPAIDPTKAAAAAAATGAAAAAVAVVRERRTAEPADYRFLRGEDVPDAIRRVARGRIDHALDHLQGKADASPEKAVHEARKDMKKLRSLLRLARGGLGDKRYRRENSRFREVGVTLSGLRDADVMLDTLESLDADPDGLRAALQAQGEVLTAGREGRLEEAISMLQAARDKVGDWQVEGDGFDVLAPGLEAVYRRGRRAKRIAERKPTTENLHEWRKRVKDRWYHLLLLSEAWPVPLSAEADEAHALSDLLGDDHDLGVLHQWAHERLGEQQLQGFDAEVEERRRLLQAEAFVLGRRLHAERPKAFTQRIGTVFEAPMLPDREDRQT